MGQAPRSGLSARALRNRRSRRGVDLSHWRETTHARDILILLIVAAVAALLGFGRVSGAALTGAKVLIGIVLVLFLLVVLGVIALA